jgi:hypothetical protein
MTQQTEMFTRLDLSGTIPMTPNEHGLFTVDQVAVLASKRGCSIHKAGDYTIEIKHPGQGRGQWKHASIMATDKGLWHPVAIFRACREAAGQPSYEIDYAKAKIKNPGGLNEVLIAEVIGADGVRPYLSRHGQYEVEHKDNGQFAQYHNPLHADDHLIREVFVAMGNTTPKAATGDYTWPMFCVMHRTIKGAGKSYEYRRALRTLEDAGLIKLTLGDRGGFGTATFEWLSLAYLQPIERKQTLAVEDAEALSDLGALS